MREVIVVKKEPGEVAQKGTINNDYKELQNYVEGIFQCVALPGSDTINIICNDEGKLMGLEANIFLPDYQDLVVGNIIFAAYDDNGEMRDLTNDEIEQISKYCELNSAHEIDPYSSEYQSYMRVEVYFDEGKEKTGKERDLDMGD